MQTSDRIVTGVDAFFAMLTTVLHTDEPYEFQVVKPEFSITVPWVVGATGAEDEAVLGEASKAARAQRIGASWAPQEELVTRLVRYATANLYAAIRCVSVEWLRVVSVLLFPACVNMWVMHLCRTCCTGPR